jgi:hypothetical protein
MKQDQTFWITNISDRNVSLADLNLTIKAFTSVNLLDNKHYSYTLQQLEMSALKGSLYKKSNRLKRRNVPPPIIKSDMSILNEASIPSRERSVYNIKQEVFEELDGANTDKARAEEAYALENADLIELDAKPLISK